MSLYRDYSWFTAFLTLCTISMLGVGCSALIDADPNRLPPPPGSDGGRVDGGPRDATIPPADGDVPPDGADLCPGGCDDAVACTVDTCEASGCAHTANDTACGDAERCSVLAGCVPRLCESNASCDDGRFCDGAERCDIGGVGSDPATGCAPGVAPTCFDDFSCTTDSCDEASNACSYVPNDAACADGVSCTVDTCEPGTSTSASGCVARADDTLCGGACATVGGNPAVRSGHCQPTAGGCALGPAILCSDTDPCTMDTCDAAACGVLPLDRDGDGFIADWAGGVTCGGDDCDDGNPDVHPGATELCNGIDDNCDGDVDEGCAIPLPDDCSTALPLTASGGGALTASGTFLELNDDYWVRCGAVGGRDAVYYFDLTALSDVVLTTLGGTMDTVLAVGTTCSAAGFGVGCDDDIVPEVNIASRIFLHRIGPMPGSPWLRVYVLVDAYDASSTGAFSVSATISPAAADSCAAPIDITEGGTLVGVMGFGMWPGGQQGSCQPASDASDPEAVAAFRGSADGSETFDAASPSFNPTLYVREAMCASASRERACVLGTAAGTGGTATLTANISSSVDGYLFVDNGVGRTRYTVDYTP